MLSSFVSASLSEHFREAAIRLVFYTRGLKKRINYALHKSGFVSKNVGFTSTFDVIEDMGLARFSIGPIPHICLLFYSQISLAEYIMGDQLSIYLSIKIEKLLISQILRRGNA